MGAGLVALAVTLLVVLGQKAQRRSGTDLTPNGAFVAGLAPGQQTCQDGELLPSDTSAVRVTIGSYRKPGPPVRLTFTGAGGKLLSSGRLRAGWREGVVQIPLTHVSTAVGEARACLRDLGPGSIAVAGTLPDPGFTMQVGPRRLEGRLRYDYMRPGRESWLQLLPTIVYRSTLAKGGLVRHWAWAGAVVLMLLAVALAARTIIREEPR
jgi:hypothetical protein